MRFILVTVSKLKKHINDQEKSHAKEKGWKITL